MELKTLKDMSTRPNDESKGDYFVNESRFMKEQKIQKKIEENPQFNVVYKTKSGGEIKGNVNPKLFGIKKNEVLYVEEIF